MKKLWFLPLILLFAAACSDQGGELVDSSKSESPESSEIVVNDPSTSSLPAGHPPMGQGMGGGMGMGGMDIQPPDVDKSITIEGTQVTLGNLSFAIDEKWVREEPTSSMRAAQFKLPGTGETDSVTLIVYRGIGGTAEANIERWISQVPQADGSSSADKAKTETKTVDDFKIITLDVSGSFAASAMMGGGQAIAEARMFAAAVDGLGGPYHFKAVGPADAMAQWEDSFKALFASFKKAE